MLSRTHDLGAFASLLTATIYYPPAHLNPATIITASIANIIGALLPDIDQGSNRLWDLLPGGNFIGKYPRRLFLSHRTLSHSIVGIYLVYQLTAWLVPKLFNASFVNPTIIIYALMIGYLSHLFLDFLTEEGIPLFFPFPWKIGFPPIKRLRIKTGHWFENLIIFPGLIIYICWLLFTFWPNLLEILSIRNS